MPPKRFFSKTKSPVFSKTGTWLVVVESTSKCKKIEEYLGTQYQCIASKGHIRQLDGLKSIDVKQGFAPTFGVIDEKREHREWMGTAIRQFPYENILIATDDDREGEAIGWHICEVFGLPADKPPAFCFTKLRPQPFVQPLPHRSG